MRVKGLIGRVAFVSALAGVVGVLAVSPASAHWTNYEKIRSGCKYTGGTVTDHTYSWTEKWYGSCSGHAWLYTKTKSGVVWSGSNATFIDRSASASDPFVRVGHRSQSGESWTYTH